MGAIWIQTSWTNVLFNKLYTKKQNIKIMDMLDIFLFLLIAILVK